MLPLGQHRKESIERHHAVHVRHGNTQLGGNDTLHLFGQVAVQVLGLVEYIDKFAGLVAMLATNGSHVFDNVTSPFYF